MVGEPFIFGHFFSFLSGSSHAPSQTTFTRSSLVASLADCQEARFSVLLGAQLETFSLEIS
jgi:hypothetical protein